MGFKGCPGTWLWHLCGSFRAGTLGGVGDVIFIEFQGAGADLLARQISIISVFHVGFPQREKRTTLVPVEWRILSICLRLSVSPKPPPRSRVPGLSSCLIGSNGSLGIVLTY